MKLSIVVPVYNEEGTVVELLRSVQAVELNGWDREVIVIDDGSSDGTLKLLRDHPQLYDWLLVHERNQGKGAALRTGFAAVTGDVVLIQDADLEYDPREYPKLLEPIASGRADVVLGSRYFPKDTRRVGYFWHTLINRGLTLLSNMLTNLTLTDLETCYKVIRTELVRQLNLQEPRFGVDPELVAKISRIPRVRIFEVPISYSGRTYSEGKKISWQDGIRAIYCILRYNLLP